MKRGSALSLLVLLILAIFASSTFGPGEPAIRPAWAATECSDYNCERTEPGLWLCHRHCLDDSDGPGGGWVHIIWYLVESGCQGGECTSTWEPYQEQALFEYVPHETLTFQNCDPNMTCYPDGSYGALYVPPPVCPGCHVTDPRDQCWPSEGPPFAPEGIWYHSKVLHSSWDLDHTSTTTGCGGHSDATCYTYYWDETWPGTDPNAGTWQFGEDDACRNPPGATPPSGTPDPQTPGPSTPIPTPGCIPGTCLPQCSFPQLHLNGQPILEGTLVELDEGPLTVRFRTPKPAGCPNGWNFLLLSTFPAQGGPAIFTVTAREAEDGPPGMPENCYRRNGEPHPHKIYVEWSDQTRYCLGWDEWGENTFDYVPTGDYVIAGTIQRRQCDQGFSTNCSWHFGMGDIPTEIPSLEARAEYWSEHDPDYPHHGPDNPYRTSSPSMHWNYGELLPVHPTANWDEPVYPGWTAQTHILRWKYLGSTTSTGRHDAVCNPAGASSCDWQEQDPRIYIYLRWYKYLFAGEDESVAQGNSRQWVYATNPVTVSFSYEVQAETVWTNDATGYTVSWPFVETLTMAVRLRYLTTYPSSPH